MYNGGQVDNGIDIAAIYGADLFFSVFLDNNHLFWVKNRTVTSYKPVPSLFFG